MAVMASGGNSSASEIVKSVSKKQDVQGRSAWLIARPYDHRRDWLLRAWEGICLLPNRGLGVRKSLPADIRRMSGGIELGLDWSSRASPKLGEQEYGQSRSSAVSSLSSSPMNPIAVIPKSTTHVFWRAVEAGAREGAKEAGAEIMWKGSLKEDDPAQQIQIFEQFVAQDVGGIVLAPIDDAALKRPVAIAMQKGIPVVIMDSTFEGEPLKDFVCSVSTNNHHAGEMAGEQLGKLLHGKGKVVLFRYIEVCASTGQREAGFLAAIKRFPEIQVIVDNRYSSGTTISEAHSAALNMLDKLKEADGIFCSNEPSTLGILFALKQNNLAGSKKLVGFDTSPGLVEGLKSGEIKALVAQNPKKMGREAVQALIAIMKGETVPAVIDTGAAVVTKENLATSEIQALLFQSKDIQWSWVSDTVALKDLQAIPKPP
jgi:ribose transport system substrate-binding protein